MPESLRRMHGWVTAECGRQNPGARVEAAQPSALPGREVSPRRRVPVENSRLGAQGRASEATEEGTLRSA